MYPVRAGRDSRYLRMLWKACEAYGALGQIVDIGRSQIYVNGSKEKNGFVPIMGRVAINGTMVRFSSVASELFVFMVKTPIWGIIIPS